LYFEFSSKYRELSIWILVFILLLSLPIRFYFLEKNQFDTAIEKSVSISERSKDLLARRGKIFDRNGIILAEDIPSYEIGLEIKNFSFNPDEIYKISFVLEIDEKKLRNRLANQNRKYLILKHSASVEKYESIIKENIPIHKFNISKVSNKLWENKIKVIVEFRELTNDKNIEISLNLLKNFSQSWPKHEKPEKWIIKNKNSITEKINYKFRK